MARPKLDIDPSEVERLASIGYTEKDVAKRFMCSDATIRNRFLRYFQKGRDKLRYDLRIAQMSVALDGNPTMLIWLGKQHLDQQDRQELTGKDGAPLYPAAQVNFFLQESVNIFQRINLLPDPAERERLYAMEMDKLQQTRLIEGKR